jgi:hypothetical protein
MDRRNHHGTNAYVVENIPSFVLPSFLRRTSAGGRSASPRGVRLHRSLTFGRHDG